MTAPREAAAIREQSVDSFLARARAAVESDPVLRVYAATEWDCLSDDGKTWVAAIVREALAQAAEAAGGKTDAGTAAVKARLSIAAVRARNLWQERVNVSEADMTFVLASHSELGRSLVDVEAQRDAAVRDLGRAKAALDLIDRQPTLVLAVDPVGHGGVSAWHVRKIIADSRLPSILNEARS